MNYRYDEVTRLMGPDPAEDLERGFRAEVHDPLWFLGKQWQMGEHRGENASTPVLVDCQIEEIPVNGRSEDAPHNPRITPPEVIIEREAGDAWTVGRRIQLGLRLASQLEKRHLFDKRFKLQGLAPPYDRLNGRGLDGRALYQHRNELGLDENLFPKDLQDNDHWSYSNLHYSGAFKAGDTKLELPKHDGGRLDWYSLEGSHPPAPQSGKARQIKVYPTRFTYPGAPHPRWWQVEDHTVDIGGFPPDRGHFATLLLIDLINGRSDDWFRFPITTQNGHLLRINQLTVMDSFGETFEIKPPRDWSLFKIRGFENDTIAVLPTVDAPVKGVVLEEVLLGQDEDANRLWAVESRLAGASVDHTPLLQAGKKPIEGDPHRQHSPTRSAFQYVPTTGIPNRWHPYEVDDAPNAPFQLIQGRAADPDIHQSRLREPAQAHLLTDPAKADDQPPHHLTPAAVPRNGLKLTRRWMLGRDIHGNPLLWMQRRSEPLFGPPISDLRFDLAKQDTVDTTGS